jgi:Protein of unknown function (DUF3761)
MKLLYALAVLAITVALAPIAVATDSSTKVVCGDGSTSKGGQGACSGHGGIDKNATAAAQAKPKMVTCSDGTRDEAGQGTCSGHGGIRKPDAKPATAAAADSSPADATARCKDGTYSHAQNHSGACSTHGGVDKWFDK